MLRASNADAKVSISSVPSLEGALSLLGHGIASSLAPQNRKLDVAVDASIAAVSRAVAKVKTFERA